MARSERRRGGEPGDRGAEPGDPDTDLPDDLDAAIAELYGGPLSSFVPGRDALARALRAAQRPDDARAVRALRKPRVLAWALDSARLADPDAVEKVVSAAEAVAAAPAGTEMRAALATLREAQHDLVDRGVRVAEDHGQRVGRAELGLALGSVVASPEALAALRAGRLVDMPHGGGFGDALVGAAPAAAVPTGRGAAPEAGGGSRAAAEREGGAPGDRKRRPRTREARSRDAPDTGTAPTGRAATAARRALERAERAEVAAADAARAAAARADEAAAELAEAERALAAAAERVEERRRGAATARAAADVAAREHEAAADAAADARAVLDELDGG